MWRRMAPAGSPSTTIRMRRGVPLGGEPWFTPLPFISQIGK
uniref:Uncharacterized protein n=1 Tax=Cruciviridae sp. TaxID=1955495 RepID=A0A1S6LVR0_9VIRU|nr:hypothetical protein [Cruciviridae sp.]